MLPEGALRLRRVALYCAVVSCEESCANKNDSIFVPCIDDLNITPRSSRVLLRVIFWLSRFVDGLTVDGYVCEI